LPVDQAVFFEKSAITGVEVGVQVRGSSPDAEWHSLNLSYPLAF
jgi:hypothetical protein